MGDGTEYEKDRQVMSGISNQKADGGNGISGRYTRV
jgi:hypothetical protein